MRIRAAATRIACLEWCERNDNARLVRVWPRLGPGRARNLGIEQAEIHFGDDSLLYTCDGDSYHLPGWDQVLLKAWPWAQEHDFRVLGGYCHPYHLTNGVYSGGSVQLHDKYAVGLLSWLMSWDTWRKFGPFTPSAQPNDSEDCNFCTAVRESGGKVGCVDPPVVVNCGLTSTTGRPSPGAEWIYRQVIPEGVVIE